jgi:hypothetical protein
MLFMSGNPDFLQYNSKEEVYQHVRSEIIRHNMAVNDIFGIAFVTNIHCCWFERLLLRRIGIYVSKVAYSSKYGNAYLGHIKLIRPLSTAM